MMISIDISNSYCITERTLFLRDADFLDVLTEKISSQSRKYLDLYHIEDYLFDVIGPAIRQRGFMEFEEFYQVGMWKSARQKQNYLKNKDLIEVVSKKALEERDELLKIRILCSLDGVDIPTASAILSVIFPEKYPVIDVRCLEVLMASGINMSKTITSKTWLKYLDIMRGLAQKVNLTPRQIDQILFSMHRETLEKRNFQNLYRRTY